MAFSLQNEKLQSFLLNMQLATVKVLLLYAWGRHRYLLLYFIFPVMRTSEVMTHWLGCRSFFSFFLFLIESYALGSSSHLSSLSPTARFWVSKNTASPANKIPMLPSGGYYKQLRVLCITILRTYWTRMIQC